MLNSRDQYEIERLHKGLYYLLAALLLMLYKETNVQPEPTRIPDDPEAPQPPRKIRRKSVWVREWLLRRPTFGQYDQLLTELHREDLRGYKNFLRITPELFHEMVEVDTHS